MQVYPAALPLDLVDLVFAVILTASLEGEQVRILWEPLQGGQQITYRHARRVAMTAPYVKLVLRSSNPSDDV
jgi:hypothetical protein